MSSHTTPAAPSKSPAPETINLEMIGAELSIVLTFVTAAARFSQNLSELASMTSQSVGHVFDSDIGHTQNLLSEMEWRLGQAKEQLEAFIDIAPADQLTVERAAS